MSIHKKIALMIRGQQNASVTHDELAKEIAERKRAEEKLQVAYAALKQTQDQLVQAEKLNALGQLASGVAHELRNPLEIIIQSVERLESNNPAEQKEILQMIKNNVRRADSIIRSLVDFSRLSKLDILPEDVNSILDESLLLIEHKTKLEKIKIVKELGTDLPKILAVKNKIEQVFINIFLNAVQAMPEGGSLTIRSYLTQFDKVGNDVGRRMEDVFKLHEKAAIVEVVDTGVGIPEENLKKISDPFFTTKGPREGMGLGLSVSKNILSMHRGLLRIESQVGVGTKVTIALKIEGSI